MIAKMKNIRLTSFQWWSMGLLAVMAAGVVAAGIVLVRGLVVTNLSDLVPWGLWITIDLSAIALSGGAFLLCATVYLLGLKQYEPLARTATYIGLIGYTMAMMCLFIDIGQPLRFWHGFVFWNTHSVLWEVTMCVGLYFTVLIMEVAPIIGRSDFIQSRWPKLSQLLGKVHRFAPYLAVAGLALSMLHQSSLGATYGVLQSRPVWYRPGLAVMFIISAGAGGLSLTVLASILSARLSSKAKVNERLIDNVAKVVGWVLVGYLYMRFWDVFAMHYTYQPGKTEGLDILLGGPLAINFWLGEMLMGALIPMVILLNSRLRSNNLLRFLALALVVGGTVAYRWDTNLVGLLVVQTYSPNATTPLFTNYVPSLIEIIVGAGIIAFGLMAFSLGVRYLNVVQHPPEAEAQVEPVVSVAVPVVGD